MTEVLDVIVFGGGLLLAGGIVCAIASENGRATIGRGVAVAMDELRAASEEGKRVLLEAFEEIRS